jgi:hypothetical protein
MTHSERCSDLRTNPLQPHPTIGPPIHFSRPHFLSISDMSDQSGSSSHLRALFELALQDYEQKTGTKLAEHPLPQQLDNCHSLEDVAVLLQALAKDKSAFRGDDKIMKSIKTTLSVLHNLATFSNTIISHVCHKTLRTVFHVSDIVLQSFPPAKAIRDSLGILLDVCTSFYQLLHVYYIDIQIH